MSVPVTTFDEQYSDPAATATGWQQTSKALEEAELFWISTVRADGTPSKVFAHAKGDPFGATTHRFRPASPSPGRP